MIVFVMCCVTLSVTIKLVLFYIHRFVLKELIQTEQDYVVSLGEAVDVSIA